MSHIRRFDHVGITVSDLDTVTAFFVGLGLEVEGRTFVEGEFVDTVIGIPGSRSHIVTLRPPDGGAGLELSSFVQPDHEPGSPNAMANELGLRNVAFEVDDLRGETALRNMLARPVDSEIVAERDPWKAKCSVVMTESADAGSSGMSALSGSPSAAFPRHTSRFFSERVVC
jgi:catechol 2,3-dioxygenase-like lactoylglutathione lyase family enzyme